MDAAKRGTSKVPSLPPPRPKSPPEYPDLYGKRRELAKVQMLEREIGFLEEELKSVERIQPASRSCKEVTDFVVANSDPLVTTNRKIRRSCRFWKWLCGKSCFNLSWICCCGCCPHLKMPRCSCSCNLCSCKPCACCSIPKCRCCCSIPKCRCCCSIPKCRCCCWPCSWPCSWSCSWPCSWPCSSKCCNIFSCSRSCCICQCPSCPDCSCSKCTCSTKCTCCCPKCPKVPRCSCSCSCARCIKNCCYSCCLCY